MFLETIEIVSISPCTADASRVRIKGDFSSDISEVLPYLNTVTKGGVYNPSIPSLTLTENGVLMTLFAREIFAGQLLNQTEAYATLDRLKKWINEVYEKRGEIEPTFHLKKRPSAMEVYALLPRSNCRECAERTCLAFATKLILGQRGLTECPLLNSEEFAQERAVLEAIFKSGVD